MMTRVNYLYRDASNYKQFGSVLLNGTLSDEQKCIVAASLDDGDGHFVPEQIGWEHPGRQMIGWPGMDDHVFCELDMDDDDTFEVVDVPRSGEEVVGTADGWVRTMMEAKAIGWRVSALF